MLHFSDVPYDFFPAKPSRFFMWMGREANRRFILPGPNHRIRGVEVRGAEKLASTPRSGGAEGNVLFLPNHATHSDPQIMVDVQRQLGMPSLYMAAYDVFKRNRVAGWLMQRCGAFSIDRDASDTKAVKAAIECLVGGEHSLTVFPEGNVHFTNDKVAPFLDGAPFFAMKAQRELGDRRPVIVVPVSIKVTYLHDERDKVVGMVAKLAECVGAGFDRDADFRAETMRVGVAALVRNLRQRGVAVPDVDSDDVPAALSRCAELVVAQLEEKMELRVKPGATLGDRARKIRSRIHQVLTDEENKADHRVAQSWADEAMLALRVSSYRGDYLNERPTLDRFAETAEKLLEDTFSETCRPVGVRRAIVQINDPIDLSEKAAGFAKSARSVMGELTAEFEAAVQDGLDEINAQNPHPGGEMF